MQRVPRRAHWGSLAQVAAVSLLVALAGCVDTTAPTPVSLQSIDVGTPPSWFLVGQNSPAYVLGTDTHAHSGRLALAMGSNDTSSSVFTGVGQYLRADSYRGTRLRLSAWVKQINVVGTDVGLWMRVDGVDVIDQFDNFSTRSLSGTADWHQVSVILDVPTDATGIAFGAIMSGKGEFLVDDMTLDFVPPTGPTTNLFPTPLATATGDYSTAPTTPSNMDFETPIVPGRFGDARSR